MTMLSFAACEKVERKTPKEWCIEAAEKEMFNDHPKLYNTEYMGYVVEDITIADEVELDDYHFNAYSIVFYFDGFIKTYLCTICYTKDARTAWNAFFGDYAEAKIGKENILDLDIVEENKIENAKTTAENFIRDGYTEQVKLTTQPMKDTTGQGRIAFMIEAEGETDSIHNLFIVAVDGQQAQLIAKIF